MTLPAVDVLTALDWDHQPPCECPNFRERTGCDQPAVWVLRVDRPHSPGPRLICDEHAVAARRCHGRICGCCGGTVLISLERLS